MGYLKHPITGKPDLLVTLSVFAVGAATIRFLLDGIDLSIAGHTLSIPHLDPLAYGSFLTPVLGVQGYVGTRGWGGKRRNYGDRTDIRPDNPDQEYP